MHPSFVTLFFLFGLATAYPTNTNATLHYLSKRDNVCAQNFRSSVQAADCIPKGVSFTRNGAAVVKTTGVTAVPADHQCDHNIEIQFLDKNLNSRGICTALAKLRAVSTNPSSATLLQPLSDILSANANLNFLSSDVNNKKRAVVASGGTAAADDVSHAVGNYLHTTSAESLGVAASLDTAINTMIAQIRAVSTANPPPAKAGRLTAADAAKRDLAAALTPANLKAAPTVQQGWQALINATPQ